MGLSGWNSSKKLKLIIDSSKVDEDLINFPINITLSSGTGQTGFDATAVFDELSTVSGTKKIAITTTISGVETELYTEIERWDWTNEEANLWVKIPTVSSGTDTELFLYYDSDHSDNTTYIGDTGNSAAQNVWDDNFKLVMHMAQDPNGDVADAIKDSTSNANHGTPAGGMTSADLVDGKVGKAIDFDGSNDYISIANSLVLSNDKTITIVFRPQSTNNQILLSVAALDNYGEGGLCGSALLWRDSNAKGKEYLHPDPAEPFNIDVWKSVTFTVLGGGTSAKLYNDDSLSVEDTSGNIYGPEDVKRIAYAVTTASRYFFTGQVCNVRISNTVRSSAWIKATYYSNWNDFVTFDKGVGVGFVFTNPTPAHLSTAYGTTEQVCLTTTISGAEGSYTYDASFYDGFDAQIGTTVSGINSGQPAGVIMTTPSGINYSWKMKATSSGYDDTSSLYSFSNMFLCEGITSVNDTAVSGIPVRLYRRSTGEYIGGTTSAGVSGTFEIESSFNEYHYVVGFYDSDDTNALIYDWIKPE